MFSNLAADFRAAIHQVRRAWAIAIAAVLILGTGIGVTTGAFSVLNSLVIRPLAFPNPERIVTVWSLRDGQDDVVAPLTFDTLRRANRSFEKLAAIQRTTFSLSEGGVVSQVPGAFVSVDFFGTFGVPPMLGRSFALEDDTPPRAHKAVISHRLWTGRFQSAPEILGRVIRLNRETYEIVGVMPASLDLRPSGEDLWIPLALGPEQMRWGPILFVVGRLKSNVAITEARAEAAVLAQAGEIEFQATDRTRGIRIGEFAADLVGDYRRQTMLVFIAIVCVLLICCSNVANLFLLRCASRAQELIIHSALGASPYRLARQTIMEGGLIGLTSVLVGIIVAAETVRVAIFFGGVSIPRLHETAVDGSALLFAGATGIVTTVFFSFLPAWRAAQVKSETSVHHIGRSASGLCFPGTRLGLCISDSKSYQHLMLFVGSGNVDPRFHSSCSNGSSWIWHGTLDRHSGRFGAKIRGGPGSGFTSGSVGKFGLTQ